MKHCPACQSSYDDHLTLCPKDSIGLLDSAIWRDGSIVKEKYQIVRQAGFGAMAVVYLAKHIAFDELRALKVMNGFNEEFNQRFIQEALLTRRLQHPNAVRIDDIEKAEDGRPFIVMEFIDGPSLKDLQKQGPMEVHRLCSLARQIASALDKANELGIVHRDIKPANILISNTPAGEQAKVVDFGIARLMKSFRPDNHLTLTNLGTVIGTPAYMSPEQALGEDGDDIDIRSDIYSLGVLMYQLLSGDLPVRADSELGFLNAHINTIPMSLKARLPDIPKSVSDIVMKCLNKDRESRPASPKALIQLIDAWQAESSLPPPEPVVENVPEPKKNQTPTRKLEEPRKPGSYYPALFSAIGWFAVLWLVDLLVTDPRLTKTSAIPWLVCGFGLALTELISGNYPDFSNKPYMRSLALQWLLGSVLAVAFIRIAGPRADQIWSLFADSANITSPIVYRALVFTACLICVAVGSFATFNVRASLCLALTFLAIAAIQLFVGSSANSAQVIHLQSDLAIPLPNLAIAGVTARLVFAFVTHKTAPS